MSNLNIQLTDLLTSHPQLISQADLDWWENLSDYWKELLSEYPYAYHKEFSQEFVDENHPLVLAKMTKTFNLDEYNDLADISALSHLTQLNSLAFQHNDIEDISPLSSLKDLKYLYIFTDTISDFSPIENLKNLEYLTIYCDDCIANTEFLAKLVNLETLRIDLCHEDLPDLSKLTKLKNLEINYPGSMCNLKTIPNLEKLYVTPSVDGNLEGITESQVKEVYISHLIFCNSNEELGEILPEFLREAFYKDIKVHFTKETGLGI